MPKMPNFADEQEAAEWFASHDTAPYMEELEEVQAPISVVRSRRTVSSEELGIRGDYLEAVKQVAARKGMPYQALIQLWLVERLRQEAPELLQK